MSENKSRTWLDAFDRMLTVAESLTGTHPQPSNPYHPECTCGSSYSVGGPHEKTCPVIASKRDTRARHPDCTCGPSHIVGGPHENSCPVVAHPTAHHGVAVELADRMPDAVRHALNELAKAIKKGLWL